MRSITHKGLQLIKHYEGFSSIPYRCPSGHLTLGFGHLIRTQETAQFVNGIDEITALELLKQDLQMAQRAVRSLIRVELTNGQYDSLVSFTYNLGSAALQRSTLRAKVNRDEHEDVPHEFMRWVFAGGRRLKGLVARRAAEARLYQQ